MSTTLTVHEPHLVNLLGHTIGALLFGAFIVLLLRQRAGARLSMVAAALAFIWNAASLIVLIAPGREWGSANLFIAIGTSALILLPAVLLHLALTGRARYLVRAAYGLSAICLLIHAAGDLLPFGDRHNFALVVGTVGFGALTLLSAITLLRRHEAGDRHLTSRVVASMSLFLFAVSFVHFGHGEIHTPWTLELLIHHAGVPLALIVLLQDYRFVLVDVFLRLTAGLALSGIFFSLAIAAVVRWNLLEGLSRSPVQQAVLFVVGIVLLLLYGLLLPRLQSVLTRLLFGRFEVRQVQGRLQALCSTQDDEISFYHHAVQLLRDFFQAAPCSPDLEEEVRQTCPDLTLPAPVSAAPALRNKLERAGVEVIVPFRIGQGDLRVTLLGRRSGGRRYLSEDLHLLAHLAGQIAEHLEHFRAAEMRRLVAQAELRALESQIHPHFLFNALNTLYGAIPREARTARRILLNLADILRYCLQPDRTLIPLEKEIEIIRAYLEIEKLRMGDRLNTEIDVDPAALSTSIPVLSLQPLVENAVKHGISRQEHGGTVRIEARPVEEGVLIRVSDTGSGFRDGPRGESQGHGLGLSNVMRRLKLCFGQEADLHIESGEHGTRIEFTVPAEKAAGVKS